MSYSEGICAGCNQPTTLKCSGCRKAWYCSVDHQREDWLLRHKDKCTVPYEVKSSKIFAARKIKKNEVILREDPLVLGPRHKGPVPASCPGCYYTLPSDQEPHTCSGCDWPVCSPFCPGLANPDRHGAECELFKIAKSLTNTCKMEIILPLRCLLLQTIHPDKWKALDELAKEAERKDVNEAPDPELTAFENIVQHISQNATKIPDCSANTVKCVFSLLNHSGREFSAPNSCPLCGVYSSYSRLMHSCLPNVRIMLNLSKFHQGSSEWKGTYSIRAKRNISKGEPLTFCFVNTLHPTLMRQRELKRTRNSQCACARCTDPHELGLNTGTIKCLKCNGLIVPTSANINVCDWLCGSCGKRLTRNQVVSFEKLLADDLARVYLRLGRDPSSQVAWRSKLEQMVISFQEVLHPNNHFCVTLKSLLAKYLGNEEEGGVANLTVEQLQQKSDLCRELLVVLASPHMAVSTEAAEILIEKSYADFELCKRNFTGLRYQDRTVEAVTECRALLRNAVDMLRSECYCPLRAMFENKAKQQDTLIVFWAEVNGLNIRET